MRDSRSRSRSRSNSTHRSVPQTSTSPPRQLDVKELDIEMTVELKESTQTVGLPFTLRRKDHSSLGLVENSLRHAVLTETKKHNIAIFHLALQVHAGSKAMMLNPEVWASRYLNDQLSTSRKYTLSGAF